MILILFPLNSQNALHILLDVLRKQIAIVSRLLVIVFSNKAPFEKILKTFLIVFNLKTVTNKGIRRDTSRFKLNIRVANA